MVFLNFIVLWQAQEKLELTESTSSGTITEYVPGSMSLKYMDVGNTGGLSLTFCTLMVKVDVELSGLGPLASFTIT